MTAYWCSDYQGVISEGMSKLEMDIRIKADISKYCGGGVKDSQAQLKP